MLTILPLILVPFATLSAIIHPIESGAPEIPHGRAQAAVIGGIADLAELKAAWDEEALYLTVLVNDSHHFPAAIDNIWDGDGIELAIDAGGEFAEGRGAQDDNDFKIIFALIDGEPQCRVLSSVDRSKRDAFADVAEIERTDEQSIYRLTLPWTLLNVVPASRPEIGLDLKVNQRDDEETPKTTHFMAGGFENSFTPSQTGKFSFALPSGNFTSASWQQTTSMVPGTPLVCMVGYRSEEPVFLEIELAGAASEIELPPAPAGSFVKVELPEQAHGSTLKIKSPLSQPVVGQQVSAQALYEKLLDKIDSLLADDLPVLFENHLISLRSLIITQHARLLLTHESELKDAAQTVQAYTKLLEGLEADAGSWEAFLDGRRSLVMAYVSPHDQSIQYYYLGLPKDWDPDKAYPLFFELHGAGNDHPMAGISSRLGLEPTVDDLAGYQVPKTYAEIDRSGYWVHPFGRGNLMYTGIARIDVMEAYDHAHKLVEIDPDRRYLYGFSMGGGGAFNMAIRTPSRWAAAYSIAPFTNAEPAGSPLTQNLEMLPYKVVAGERDRLNMGYQPIVDDLADLGIEVETEVIPELGHSYARDLQQSKIEWLKQHTRKRPDVFTFVANDRLVSECWGVELFPPLHKDTYARAVVKISGNHLQLETTNSEQVLLKFRGPDNLNLSGSVQIDWNGKRYTHDADAEPTLMLEQGQEPAE